MCASNEDPSNQLFGSSITYRIAVGPQQGRKVFTLQTLPDLETDSLFSCSVGEVAGFSLHAGIATKANERVKLERLCRYITRPAVSTKRLSMTRNGRVRYELKTPWRNGTTHVIFEPLDFIARLVALVPKPRVNLTRFHGVFAPNSKYRSMVTPARRGKRKKCQSVDEADQTPAEIRASMTWAKRLKRVFDIDIETCDKCGGDVRIIASIEDPIVIEKILTHLNDSMIACGPTVELSLPQPANALNLRVSQLLEAEVGGNLQKTGRKAEISSDFIILGFWENSLYSSYTPTFSLIIRITQVDSWVFRNHKQQPLNLYSVDSKPLRNICSR